MYVLYVTHRGGCDSEHEHQQVAESKGFDDDEEDEAVAGATAIGGEYSAAADEDSLSDDWSDRLPRVARCEVAGCSPGLCSVEPDAEPLDGTRVALLAFPGDDGALVADKKEKEARAAPPLDRTMEKKARDRQPRKTKGDRTYPSKFRCWTTG